MANPLNIMNGAANSYMGALVKQSQADGEDGSEEKKPEADAEDTCKHCGKSQSEPTEAEAGAAAAAPMLV